MGITNKPVYINIARPSMYAVLYAKQSDVNRAFTAVFNNDGEAWAIPENAVVSIWYRGAAGEGNYTKGIEINGNTAVVPLIPQMLSVPGTGLLCIIINTAAGDQIGTWNIPYFVEEIPGGNSEAATEFYTAFSEIASEVAAYALEAKESARAAAASANEVSSTVSINPQALTEEQQTQARENIGAAATANLAGCWIDFTDENGTPTDEPYLHWEEGGDGKKPDTTFSELLAAVGNAVSVEAQSFTEAQKAQARANIGAAAVGAGGGTAGNAVLYDKQTLTDAQKAQARSNIGACTVAEVLAALPTWEGGSY